MSTQPVYGNAQTHQAVRHAAYCVVRNGLARVFFPRPSMYAAALAASATAAGLTSLTAAVHADLNIPEVAGVVEEVQRLVSVLEAALEADWLANGPKPALPEHPDQLTLDTPA